MQKRYDYNVIMIVIAISSAIIVIFIDLFDNVYATLSARQIVILIFKHILILFLTIIDHKYDFNLILSLYINFFSYM